MTTPSANRTLGKDERLSDRELISAVVKSGRSVNVSPFRLVGLITELDTEALAQVAFAIPKRNVKRAVVRNRIRRLMREAYRAEKDRLQLPLRTANKQCAWLFVYQGRTPVDLTETRHKISTAIERWLQQHLPA